MSKEKLTVESIRKRIEESIEWNLGGKAERKEKVLTESILIVQSFLKQIQDEIICVEDEPISEDSYFGKEDIFVSITKIVKVFNKYLNEK